LQTEITLIMTKAEVTGMELLTKLRQNGFHVIATDNRVHCKVFKDNSRAIEIANVPKY
jgi:hypothetical protein